MRLCVADFVLYQCGMYMSLPTQLCSVLESDLFQGNPSLWNFMLLRWLHQVSFQSNIRLGWRFQDGCHLSEWKHFSKFESPYNALMAATKHRFNSILFFWRRWRLKNFKMAAMLAILDIRSDWWIASFHFDPMPPIEFWLNETCGFEGDGVWRISKWLQWRPSCRSERND